MFSVLATWIPPTHTHTHTHASDGCGVYEISLVSLWLRFAVLLCVRVLSGICTEGLILKRLRLLQRAESAGWFTVPSSLSQAERVVYLSDMPTTTHKLSCEPSRNMERSFLYFCATTIVCAYSVFQRADAPCRYSLVAFL
eukprot:GHVR01007011.1.p1 GENE.GHVR01007011.1~~GHVR01007011.1.p1  ORF type:complete len:140 (+),score=41.15 GHVR01007011.1:260-679(+)